MTQKPLKFVVGNSRYGEPNTCYLKFVDWNDYGFYTSFELHYTDDQSNSSHIGRISIMHSEMRVDQTENFESARVQKFLPSEFYALDENFCSLGEQSYYETLILLPLERSQEILRSLRDCAFDNSIFDQNLDLPAMQNSLLRGVDHQRVRHFYPSIIQGNARLTPYRFRYSLNSNSEQSIDVRVVPHSSPPSNIHVLIGSNGVGKTRILSGIVDSLTKINNQISESGEIEFINDKLEEQSEKFVNLVSVVFSAFDKFIPPPKLNKYPDSIKAHYIGLKNPDGKSFKSLEQIDIEFSESIDNISQKIIKMRLWKEAIELLSSDNIFNSYELQLKHLTNAIDNDKVKQIFNEYLSSGHRIVLLTITRLVEIVDEKTLVVVDEPENHLHPPLLSSFIRALSNLLIKRNGVAIIATHSPVVLQEVPSSCVTKIERVRSAYSLDRPQIETYAENIDTLTREVFRLQLENSGFYKTIKERIQSNPNYTFQDFMTEFGSKVGSEGRALAKSLIALRED